jgi:hypothetical protein
VIAITQRNGLETLAATRSHANCFIPLFDQLVGAGEHGVHSAKIGTPAKEIGL